MDEPAAAAAAAADDNGGDEARAEQEIPKSPEQEYRVHKSRGANAARLEKERKAVRLCVVPACASAWPGEESVILNRPTWVQLCET